LVQTIASSENCTVDLVFTPTSAGAKDANLSIPSNDLYTPNLNLSLSGTAISISPIINPISDETTTEGTPYTGPTPSLSQGTLPVTWLLQPGPSGMTINSSTGVVSWPALAVSGSPHTITIRATNSAGYDDESWILNITTDNDGILDSWEIANFGNLTTANATTDYDKDGLLDKDEYANNTDPKDTDSDNDNMPDGWEVAYGLDPLVDDRNGDLDGDGITNLQEYLNGINPTLSTKWLDFIYTGAEDGTFNKPYNTLAEAINAVAVGGEVITKGGITSETFSGTNKITKKVTIKSYNGTSTIGKQ